VLDGRSETDAKLGGDGVPTQCELQALGHRASTAGKHCVGNGERVSNRLSDWLVVGVRGIF
jgi:hypothetical protein